MKRIVFCNVAHMKYYRGITKDDKPVNGGKFVNETGTAFECYNFFPVNHSCYGYFQQRGEQIKLERVDKTAEYSDILRDVTVIWVANRKIVGWYEHAEMYRYWQSFTEPEFDKNHIHWHHWFKVRERDVFLIPEEKRNFDVPSASKNGKGKGMGQANIWYADTAWAKKVFLPKVEKYLKSILGKYPIKYLTSADINREIPPSKRSTEYFFEKGCKLLDKGDFLHALKIFNYLIYNADTPYNVCAARYDRALALEKLLLYDEALESYKCTLYEFNRLGREYEDDGMDLACFWQIGRIYSVLDKNSRAYAMWKKIFEQEEDDSEKCAALMRMMWACELDENWEKLRELLKVYDKLGTKEFPEDVKKLRKLARQAIR